MNRMRILLLIGGLVLSFSYLYGQKSDLEKDHLIGNISSIRETMYSIPKKTNNKTQNIISDIIHNYNAAGNKIKSSIFKNDSLFSYRVYEYNKDSLLINSKEYNADGSLYIVVNYFHDEKGFITKAKYNRSFQKSYDDQRNSIEVEYNKYYNQLFGYIVYRNDYKGYVLHETYFTDENTLAFKYSYGYNYKFYRVETKYYNNKGKLSWKEKMKYGLKDNKKESTLFKSNRKAQTTTYTYEFDSNNNWTKQIETRLLYDNFFADDLNDNTIITIRKIIYF